MERKWRVLYYSTINGKTPVKEFINSRSIRNRQKIAAVLEHLENVGNDMRRPFSDYLKDEIHELRIKLSSDETRIMYFFCYEEYIVLTHCFIKRTKQIPEKEIKKAVKYRNDFINRYSRTDLEDLII